MTQRINISSRSKTWLLALLSVAFLFIFYALPINRAFRETILHYCRSFPHQWSVLRANPDPDQMLSIYHGANYAIPHYLKTHLAEEDIVLLPPREYLLRYFPPEQILWAEPRVMYYMVGPIHFLTTQSPNWTSATHTVLVEVKQGAPSAHLVSLREPGMLDAVRRLYFDAGSTH